MNKEDLVRLYETDEIYEPGKKLFKKQRWVNLEEAELLRSIAEETDPDFIFESGTANGYSTMWLALQGCDVYTYDIADRAKVWDDTGKPSFVHYTEDRFSTMTKIARNRPGRKLFFIDGNHAAYALREDLGAVLEVIHPGDVIVLHDVHDRCPGRYFRRLKSQAASSETYDTKRGMAKLVWGTVEGDLDGEET